MLGGLNTPPLHDEGYDSSQITQYIECFIHFYMVADHMLQVIKNVLMRRVSRREAGCWRSVRRIVCTGALLFDRGVI